MPVTIGGITAYTLHELAEKFTSTTVTFRAYIREGKLKAQRVGGKWIVTEAALQEFLERPQGGEASRKG